MSAASPNGNTHATRSMSTRQIAAGAGLVGVAGLGAVAGLPEVAVPIGAIGALYVGLGVQLRLVGAAAMTLNRATSLALQGKLAEASALVDTVPGKPAPRYVARAVEHVRARIALRRGDPIAACAHADAGLALPRGVYRASEQAQLVELRGLRAFLRASLGDRAGAEEDARAVRHDELASPSALAHAALGEAVALERAGEHEALRELLRRERRLLLEHVQPRERAIVRAYQRMLSAKAKARSIYRESPPREDALAEPPLADWVARIAPGAAPYVRRGGATPATGASGPAAAPVDEAARAAAEARLRPPRPFITVVRVVALWLALIVVLLAIWQLLASDPAVAPPAARPAPTAELDLFGLVRVVAAAFVLLFGAVFGAMLVRGRRGARALFATATKAARGDDAAAEADLERLRPTRLAGTSAGASLQLAGLASRRGDFEASLARCDAGIAKLGTNALRAMHSDLLFPGLVSQRAYALAALGRATDADAEVEALARACPGYFALPAARLVVGLMNRAHQGDVRGAAGLAEQLGDLPIGARDELVADLARAANDPEAAGPGEIERLAEELAVDREARGWIERVAPGVLAAFERARAAMASGVPDAG